MVLAGKIILSATEKMVPVKLEIVPTKVENASAPVAVVTV